MLKSFCGLGLLIWCASSGAQVPGPSRKDVSEVKPLLVEAIDAPGGEAHGRLTGELVDAIGRQFQTSAPINVDVKTLVRYTQEGCRRLSVLIWQENVRLRPDAAGARQTVEFGINYCRDGLPPRSLDKEVQP